MTSDASRFPSSGPATASGPAEVAPALAAEPASEPFTEPETGQGSPIAPKKPRPFAAPPGSLLIGLVAAAVAWVTFSLAVHPGFQPIYTVRAIGPVGALMIGAAFAHQVARWRRSIDARRDVDPMGKSLFLGLVMVVATALGWLMVTQAFPATVTAGLGVARSEAGTVSQKMPATAGPDCPDRLAVTSASIPREMDECVDAALWRRAVPGAPVTLHLLVGPLGAEILDVR